MGFNSEDLEKDFLKNQYGIDVDDGGVKPSKPLDIEAAPVENTRTKREFNTSTIWSHLSKIWSFLKAFEKPNIEFLWKVFSFIASHLTHMTDLIIKTHKVEEWPNSPYTEYFSFNYNIMESIPYYLDYTAKNPDYIIHPIEYITMPEDEDENIYSYVYIPNEIYYAIRNFSQGYLVVPEFNKFYPFVRAESTEELKYLIDKDGNKLTNDEGELIPNPKYIENDGAKNIYRIKVKGDLKYVEDSTPSCYLTTGRAYELPKYIKRIDYLKCYSHRSNGKSTFIKNIDYIFYKNNIEFIRELVDDGIIYNSELMYIENADILNHHLIDFYGDFVDIYDVNWANYDNEQLNQAFYNILKGMQVQNNVKSLQAALQSLYGLPSSPVSGIVSGVFESGGYVVKEIDNDDSLNNMLQLKLGFNEKASQISPLFQYNTKILYHGYKTGHVKHVNYEKGIITVDNTDKTIKPGDRIYVELVHEYDIQKVYTELSTESPGFVVGVEDGSPLSLQYLINTYNDMYENNIRPEFLVYGFSENVNNNINGLYHMQSIEYPYSNSEDAKINIYQYDNEKALLEQKNTKIYNDHIISAKEKIENINGNAKIHVSWPTPKFVLLYGEDEQYYKIYLDSTIDINVKTGDKIQKGHITRNVALLNNNIFNNWTSFMKYMEYSLLHTNMCINEVIYIIPGALPGRYLPVKIYKKD